MLGRARLRADEGETLIELIVAILILGVCVVAIGTSIVLSVKVSSIHRDQATAGGFLHNYAEAIQSSYRACTGNTPPNYVSIASLPTPNGFSTPTAAVTFWDGTSFSTSSCPATDPGLQQVTFTLTSNDGFVSESLVTIVRSTT